MQSSSILKNIARQNDGTYTTSHGDFELRSAFQPIFGTNSAGRLELRAFEGLVRANRNGEPVSPGVFFESLSRAEMQDVDSLCRTLHILNLGLMQRRQAKLFVNFHPGVFVTPHDIRHEVDRISLATYEAGLTPDRIVCEIARANAANAENEALLVERLRQLGFRIAIDEYGEDESDAQRVDSLRPDYVKFEASWVLEFLDNPTGSALLKMMVQQFSERGIETIFEALEEIEQVEICQELNVPLMQGYVLARPQIAPTNFNQEYPEQYLPLSAGNGGSHSSPAGRSLAGAAMARRQTAFGKRQS
ncbi:EAL domain-containing protein [Rhizobium sp. L1K21]|uniref:EAL domain-containing protein n=1 Tax=Rhizobium sp. L1K21 TaxID=2954933 RepID=UPI0020930720|nr:EAL domain-containing protein [Rhizobium sp. L1K21]MCO6185492.1 EAL domain-containing protein [Rhizobium sp. L1K21]